MSIWRHTRAKRSFTPRWHDIDKCPFCKTPLTPPIYLGEPWVHRAVSFDFRGSVCITCGWWHLALYEYIDREDIEKARNEFTKDGIVPDFMHSMRWTHATLREFDITDSAAAVNDVRDHILADYSKRFYIHPHTFEKVVTEIFRDCGWDAVYTQYSKDGGVDVYIAKGDLCAGVQVKRYSGNVGVRAIREMVGAMVHKGLTNGIVVTTGDFTSVARSYTVDLRHQYCMELVDSERLFEALKITKQNHMTIEDIFMECGFDKPNKHLMNDLASESSLTAVIDLRKLPDP